MAAPKTPTPRKRKIDPFAAIERGDAEGLRQWLAAGGDPEEALDEGLRSEETLLQRAARSALPAARECAMALLEAGADALREDQFGSPALVSSTSGHGPAFGPILEASAQAGRRRPGSWRTALSMACATAAMNGRVEALEALLGACPKGHAPKAALRALSYAIDARTSADPKPLNPRVVQCARVALATPGLDLESPLSNDRPPLELAIWRGEREIADAIRERLALREASEISLAAGEAARSRGKAPRI